MKSPGSAHRTLLELEKGTSGPASQLLEAARVIGVDLFPSCDSRTADNRGTPATGAQAKKQKTSAPKEEWVLRWLLKKLRASAQQGQSQSSYRLDVKTWILLRLLFDRIPVKTLAFILTENKFLSILKDSLYDLANNASTFHPERPIAQDAQQSESSVTIHESPVPVVSNRGKKRKRTENGGELVEPTESTSGSWIDTFYAILYSVKALVGLSEQALEDKSTINSQLKLVLRGEPQLSAAILGRSFELAQKAVVEWHTGVSDFGIQLLFALSSVLDIWRLSSERLGDGTDLPSNDTFPPLCLLEALNILTALQHFTSESAEIKSLRQGIEQLVVLHFILPVRQSFFSEHSKESRNANDKLDPAQIKLVFKDISSRWKQSQDISNTKLLPTLLDIAIRAVPRDTFRRQENEAPWLETLFVVLSTIAGCPLFEDVVWNKTHRHIPIFESLLQVTIDRKVNISLDTVTLYATRFSGLLDIQTEQIVQWSLISKIIRAGVDVFLPNSGIDESNQLLSNLLSQITSLWLGNNVISSEIYEIIKIGIVIPLLKGFAVARDIGSFLDIWSEQLKSLEAARLNGADISYFSVWEDDDLAAAYRPLVADLFSENQTRDHLQDILTQHSFESEKDSANQYAVIVLLDAILRSPLPDNDSLFRGQLLAQIFSIISKSIRLKQKQKWRWRLWRLSQRFGDQHVLSMGDLTTYLRMDLLPNAVSLLQTFHRGTESGKSRNDCLEAFEAFKLVVLAAGKADSPQYREFLNTIIPFIVPAFSQVAKSTAPAWNGRAETMVSPSSVCIGYLVALLATPVAVSRLTSENRRLLFNSILTAAEHAESDVLVSFSAQTTVESQLLEIWRSFVSHDWLLGAPAAVYEVVNTLYHNLKERCIPDNLLISSLLSIPTRLIPRHQRGMLLDFLQHAMLRGQVNSTEMCTDILSLMTRLADLPKSSAQLTSNWDELWKLSDAISSKNGDSCGMPPFQSFRQLYQVIIDRVLDSSDVQRHLYLQKTFDKVSATVPEYDKVNFDTMEFFMLGLSLRTLRAHQEHFDGELKVENLNALRERVFNILISGLQSVNKVMKKNKEPLDVNTLTGVLNALEDFEDLVKASKDVQKAIRKLEERMDTASDDIHVRRLVKRRLVASQKPGKDLDQILMQSLSLFPIDQLHGNEQKLHVRDIHLRLSSLPEKKLVSLIRKVRDSGFSGKDAAHRLLLTGIAISCLEPIEDTDGEASQELSALFTALLACLVHSATIEPFSLATECLEMILRNKSRCITQWNIDNTLGTLAVTISPSGPKIAGKYSKVIYTRTCHLLRLLFGQYRQKISGRFHLILPVMQRLLRLLFTPSSRPQKSSSRFQSTTPPWADDIKTLHQPSNATQFSRLLTTLCDPTVSAVQRGHRPNSGLTDNTKKVKSLAGQHLQYLVMEYAMCQLRGQLAPEVKAALVPGLYAVLDVMSKETMRGMNAAMDSSSRAVFKGLYDDYVRFGKWNHGDG
ncbi:hypothetical protein PAAG_00518 [Paracoccidioides lutzii Pb01]|uniref:Nucleolar 27S pre-rRNA processing Urb2/Npa2 C-terminal domain-containing protein n=1 Tax=Paracoccidioides lutzii (strain ATCC MYA-826 / Pb01) TaxID=502779 RepID=C1GPS3_PARBA|nr:hypothetical protein PAAG_00518 [Paracoccidioides lutzii Pb01]EEH36195.2 hypothetical protein PAAG_00518 [Paracoccidioides lutzii Pb01]